MKGTSENQSLRYSLVQSPRVKKTFHLQETPYKESEGTAGKKQQETKLIKMKSEKIAIHSCLLECLLPGKTSTKCSGSNIDSLENAQISD